MTGGLSLIVTAAAGWLWGSFLNQVIDRTPSAVETTELGRIANEHSTSPQAGSPLSEPSLFRPARSHCLACGNPIAWRDNIPILSYLLLRGKCRHCRVPIGRRTLWVETVTPLALVAVHLAFGWRAVAYWAAFWISASILGVTWAVERRRPSPYWLVPAAIGAAATLATATCPVG